MQSEDMARLALQNCFLMGFDPAEARARHDVDITEEVLLAPSGVQRHMEVLMHFIVLKAFPDSEKAMKLVWPIVEKTQARDFRRLVTDRLTAMQRDKEMPSAPLVRSTTMDSPCGPKFLAILFHATQATMRRSLAHMKQPPTPVVAPFPGGGGAQQQQQAAAQLRMLLLHTSRERKMLLQKIADVDAAHKEWRGFAERIIESYEGNVAEREAMRSEMNMMMGEGGCGTEVLSTSAAEDRKLLADQVVGRSWARIQVGPFSSPASCLPHCFFLLPYLSSLPPLLPSSSPAFPPSLLPSSSPSSPPPFLLSFTGAAVFRPQLRRCIVPL